MAEYRYPDKGDRLTIALINNEYDNKAWQESEARILDIAADALAQLSSKVSDRTLLDVGCGTGRLFDFFAKFVGRIEALEPDNERYRQALEKGRLVEASTGVSISVINEVLGDNKKDNFYDIILSSHVIQHLGQAQVVELFKTMARKLKPGGLLLLMTTYADDSQEKFYCESWDSESRKSRQISFEEFENIFRDGGGLPVRMFSKESVVKMAAAVKLKLTEFHPFHGKSIENGEEYQPRDAFYIFVRE